MTRGSLAAEVEAAYAAAALEGSPLPSRPRLRALGEPTPAQTLAARLKGEVVADASAPADLAVAHDWIERLPEAQVSPALAALARTGLRLYLHIWTVPAHELSRDGANPRLTVRGAHWWVEQVEAAFGRAARVGPERVERVRIVTWEPTPEARRALEAVRRRLETKRRRDRVARRFGTPLRLLLAPPQSQARTLAELAGRRVAVVGNAAALAERGAEAGYGARIDAADVVLRFNRMPIVSPAAQGSRTDWLVTGLRDFDADLLRVRAPRLIVWTGDALKHIAPEMLATPFRLHLLSMRDRRRLRRALGRKPSAGLMAIDLLARSDAAAIDLYGFDFNTTPSLSGARRPEQEAHDFQAEAAWVRALMARDARFRLHG